MASSSLARSALRLECLPSGSGRADGGPEKVSLQAGQRWTPCSVGSSRSTFLAAFTPMKAAKKDESVCRNGAVLKICAVLDKSSGMGKSGQSSNEQPLDPARVALERLFAQAQTYEERRLDPNFTTETELEDAVAQIENDLATVVSSLRQKEEELKTAELHLGEERDEVEKARTALMARESKLNAARAGEMGKKGELTKLRLEVTELKKELSLSRDALAEREEQVLAAKGALAKTEEQLRRAELLASEKSVALDTLNAELLTKEYELRMAAEREAEQARVVKKLEQKLERKESLLEQAQGELTLNQQTLQLSKTDLQERVTAWLGAQEELKAMEYDLDHNKPAGMTRAELDQVKVLLIDVHDELKASQDAVLKFQHDIRLQKEVVVKAEKDLNSQRAVLRMRELELAHARREVAHMRDQVRLARASYERVSKQLKEQRSSGERLQAAVTASKQVLKNSVSALNMQKKELRLKDAALSDAQLAMQLKEAELVGLKLELQGVRSAFSSAQLALNDKSLDLDLANRRVAALETELMTVKMKLKEKEEELARLTVLLGEKDVMIESMRADLSSSNLQLAEATSVVEKIAALSRSLAQTAALGAGVARQENPVLMQTNYELFAANKALLNREVELQRLEESAADGAARRQAVEAQLREAKDSLQEKEVELVSVKSELAIKDQELRRLLGRWEQREVDVRKLREDVHQEAAVLSSIRTFVADRDAAPRDDGPDVSPAMESLEVGIAKLETETAVSALRGLSDLSQDLLANDSHFGHSSSGAAGLTTASGHAYGLESGGADLYDNLADYLREQSGLSPANEMEGLLGLQEQLAAKDSALEYARSAMDGLTQLTNRLLSESADYRNRPVPFAVGVH
eukprot:TRINITY_DN3707_c0_g1_i1.p1 TRINITY_DN3707_c0_g1~~TRINITY_DN3707_c0_g1_i1.p1  ORF type:complete len:868 (+),score=201.60 TRINITY_DN3707_c0_g1_i1:310-2913(+)